MTRNSDTTINSPSMAKIANGQSLHLSEIPNFTMDHFQQAILDAVDRKQRVAALFGSCPDENPSTVSIYVVLADDSSGRLHLARTSASDAGFPSLTLRCPQVHLFEREIAEQFGIVPHGHPWLKPVRFNRGYRPSHDAWNRPVQEELVAGLMEFYQIGGGQVHEVAVGPVHAGIIEPGHFRFQCDGETVLHLEVSLGYQHRGVERAMLGGPNRRSIHYAETLAGDTTIAHTTAYAEVLESLCGSPVSPRAESLRGIALELERLANHAGDLGAMAGDIGFLPTASFCGRIRGDFLNMTAALCGSRFGRGMVRPGGVGFDVDLGLAESLLANLNKAESDCRAAINLLWETASVMARFEGIGALDKQTANELGMVGPSVRACGLDRDVRRDHASGIFRFHLLPVSTWQGGDVFARAYVRWLEIQRSIVFVREQLKALPAGDLRRACVSPQPGRIVVAMQEGWRGELCHIAITSARGTFECYKVVDPSFHNWAGVAMALRGREISDFPLCNKSFSLSYCGHDL